MKAGLSIQELTDKLVKQASENRDFLVSPSKFSIDAEGKVNFNAPKRSGEGEPIDAEFEEVSVFLTNHAHRQLGDYVGIPAGYYDRLKDGDPELLATNVNRWLAKQDVSKPRLIRTNANGGRAILSNSYRTLDNLEIAITALQAIAETHGETGLVVETAEITEDRLYIQAVTPRVEREIKRGDVVQAGFILGNSEIGKGAAFVKRLVKRLVCLNGLIVPDGKYTARHLGRKQDEDSFYADDTKKADDHAFLLKLRDNILDAVNPEKLEEFSNRALQLTDQRVTGDVVKVVEEVAERINASVSEQAAILRNLISGGDLSAWGVINAVTAEANTAESYDRSVELEAAGGSLLELPAGEWRKVLEAA
jgi:hypothetical protein